MKTKINNISETEIQLEIEVPTEDFNSFIDKAILALGKEIVVPGFRQGKIPKEKVIEKVGLNMVLTEASRLAMEKYYKQAVLENDLEPISQPRVEILKLAMQNPFIFKATFFVLPKVELGDYKKSISGIKTKQISIDDSEVQQALEWLQKSRPDLTEIFTPAQKDNFIEFEFYCDLVQNNQKQQDGFIIGKGSAIPGFEDQLIGMSSGQEKEFTLDFPKDFYQKELAEKSGKFKVKINSVKKVALPEINDEFAKKLGEFETLDELKENIKKGLIQEKQTAESQKTRIEMVDKIAKDSKLTVPDSLVQIEKQARFDDLKNSLVKNNVDFNDYLTKIKKTEKELLKALEEQSEKEAKRFLILREISKQENISVSEQELEDEADKILTSYQSPEQAQDKIDPDKLKSYTEERLRNEKVFQSLEKLTKK